MDKHPFRDFRDRHGLTQAELGKALGLQSNPQGRISHYERGRRALSMDIAHSFIAFARTHGDEYVLEDIFPADGHAAA